MDIVKTSAFLPSLATNLHRFAQSWFRLFPPDGIQYVQKKKTIYPEWSTSFDAHLYERRLIQMVVMQRPNKLVADVNIGAQMLADKCKDNGVASVWVCIEFVVG